MDVNIDISPEKRKFICEILSVLLAETYILYLKTQNFHWNVRGARFYELHKMFEEQYTELALAIDEIAERIRTLGKRAPGSFIEFSELSSIKESRETPTSEDMLIILAENNEHVAKVAKGGIQVAASVHDDPTIDLLTQRAQRHEKVSWMLRASQS